ncbi:hypothetical protein DY000_02025713 [Brassica cretica]|uniref:DNA repair protein UVH3 n=1 Tax=Brassica cretica TaxID=69181 RepID=A0ABQ7EK33_BRACR|nr:hypothetical protein DY000_02025713 [Brassica cretica]
MGVQGIWELLAPVGRRVSVETLAGKRLAIDASIWMVQFIKAMRDEKGDMVQNAHLIGFFRRICKLLFLRTKPVFVFDGGTPALKRRTVIARRRQRENAQTKIRKTAEKLLLNRLKEMRLKEQANDLKKQRLQQSKSAGDKKRVSSESVKVPLRDSADEDGAGGSCFREEKMDEISSASKVGENVTDDAIKGSSDDIGTTAYNIMMFISLPGPLETSLKLILTCHRMAESSLYTSMPSIMHLAKYDPKGKGVLLDEDDLDNRMKSNIEQGSSAGTKDYQEKLDEMLAASLAAEEEGTFTNKASSSAAEIPSEEEGSEEDEQILLPAMNGNVDPAVLASLPPSMQLDLLVQMREKLMSENRQKYQKVKKAPEKFSELQIEAYLKTVAFRREINEVQRSAGGRAVGGVQTSRIASEANREFIFSSSFSGDKEVLASAREGRNDGKQNNTPQQSLPVPVKNISSVNKSDATTELEKNEPANPDENIEVYIDERGRLRIRNRHMGIQMTRDIQRNLHLMKEKEKTAFGSTSNNDDETSNAWENFPSEDQFLENLPVNKDDVVNLDNTNDDSMLRNQSAIEISFEHDGGGKDLDDEDDMFLRLAAGEPGTISSAENDPKEDSLSWASDSDWEEVPVEQSCVISELEVNSSNQHVPEDISSDEEAAREDSTCENASNSMDNDTVTKFSKGYLEEEADLQEAIQKSLLDLHDKESEDVLEKNQTVGVNLVDDKPTQDSLCSSETVGKAEEEGTLDGIPILKASGAINEQPNTSVTEDGHRDITKQIGTHPSFSSGNVRRAVGNEMPQVKSVISPEKSFTIASESSMVSTMAKHNNEDGSESFGGESIKVSPMPIADEERISSHIEVLYDTDSQQETREENKLDDRTFNIESSIDLEEKTVPVELSEAILEEEMRVLDQEYVNLGDEQRKLERNAESVSSEMFAEIQELLQIFGLPYIIAPMEAEAQCAFMEQSNLIDGIVTDDSDVFLFGARSVYKNIFDDRKYVETYFMKDIEKELGLSRDKIIRMAMLLGSDYTEGISGVGIVNAIEVVTAFPEDDGLQKFREWVESPDPTILGKTDAKTGSGVKKRGYGSADNESTSGVSADDTEEIKQIFMDKHRKVSKNWHIPATFPSEAVISAYLDPQVDRSTEIFSWGKPDLLVLRKLCWEKFGWNGKKTDDLLLPVLKEYEKRETQLRMEAFYSFSERFAKIRSKRIKKAVKGIGGGLSSEVVDHTLQEGPRKGNKKRLSPYESEDNTSEKDLSKTDEKATNKRKRSEKPSSSRGGNGESLSENLDDDDDDFLNNLGNLGNVSEERAQNEPTTMDASNNDCPSEDYIQMGGGGFCVDEAETGGDAHVEDKARNDYRVMGGGFCVDEDETGEEDDAMDEEVLETEDVNSQNKAKRQNEDASLEEYGGGIEIGNSSAGGLSAMPFLKRKKRKN